MRILPGDAPGESVQAAGKRIDDILRIDPIHVIGQDRQFPTGAHSVPPDQRFDQPEQGEDAPFLAGRQGLRIVRIDTPGLDSAQKEDGVHCGHPAHAMIQSLGVQRPHFPSVF